MSARVLEGTCAGHGCVAVTGAAAGIGLQVVIDLAEAGRHVWCLDRDPEGLSKSVALARAVGEADALVVDVADEAHGCLRPS